MGVIAFILVSCSASKNTAKSRFWQSFSARYNTYYNGTVAYIDGSLEKEKGNKDNYTEMIPLYSVGNKKSAGIGKGNFDKAIEKCEKAIKLHSIKKRPEWTKKRRKTEKDIEWLNRKEYNPMLWKAWMLMGRSQFFEGDFDAASTTFSYISRIYQTQPAIYGRARAWLAKCYIEQDWLYDAEDVIRNMQRDSIHWSAQKDWNYTYADYYIHTGDYEKAVPYLRQVIKHEGRKVQKAREWYLMGQLQHELGNNQDAYKAYKKVIAQNPPYEIEFNARIAMTEVMAASDAKKMISRLKRMARSDNNKEYLDQVYYALGNIYMNQLDTLKAISAYEKGAEKATRSGVEKGVLLLRLGDIYWDMEKYSDAGRCYGQAIGMLDKERKDYQQLSERSRMLDQLVPYTEAIHLQDSLQELAKMDEKDRNAAIDRVIEALKKKEKEEKDRLAEENAAKVQSQNGGNQNARTPAPQVPTQTNGQWYFYNQMAVNQGKTAFQKQWGKRENTDDWQRINRTVVAADDVDLSSLTDEQRDSLLRVEEALAAAEDSLANDSAANDPHKREYYLAQIPFTEEQVEASNLVIMDGLYNSGVIFKDKLDNLPLSDKQFTRLHTQYPTFEHMDDAYYHMFLLYSRMQRYDFAEVYVEKLKEEYPDSKWTALLSDPFFAENQKFGVHIEDSLYTATYDAFKADRVDEVRANNRISAERFPLGANRDKFLFLSGMSRLNSGDAEGCLEDMQKVVSDFPQSKLAEMAGMIVNGVKGGKKLYGGKFDISDVWARRSVILNDSDSINNRQFVADRDVDFTFMIAYKPSDINENQLLYELAKYNFTSYMVRNFEILVEDLDGLHAMKVSGFRNYDEALEYAHQFYEQTNVVSKIGKSRTYIVSNQNLEILGTLYSYEDYEAFYDEHFAPLPKKELMLEDADAGRALDDGGSLPSNIKSEAPQNPARQTAPDNQDKPAVPVPAEDPDAIVLPDDIPVPDAEAKNPDEGFIIPDDAPAGQPQDNADDAFVIPEEEAVTPAENTEDTGEGGFVLPVEDVPTPAVQPQTEPAEPAEPEMAEPVAPAEPVKTEPAEPAKAEPDTKKEEPAVEEPLLDDNEFLLDDEDLEALAKELSKSKEAEEAARKKAEEEARKAAEEDEYFELEGF